tara:strand:- start:941 stop:1192 length:252 start_codon:yes stop_codon:yes gene_type:complete
MPFMALITSLVNFKIFTLLFFLSIYPGTILYFYVKDEIQKNKDKYEKITDKFDITLKKINELMKEIDETENSCRCLDTYIDEL